MLWWVRAFAVWLLVAAGAPYLALDTFLRRVPPPESELLGRCAARALWQRASLYRGLGLLPGLLVWGWVTTGLWRGLSPDRALAGVAGLAGLGLTLLLDRWIWRFGLRKQFPHLRPWL